MGGILKFLNHEWFNIVLRDFLELCTSFVRWAAPLLLITFYAQSLHSAPQTPSQALPKMFQKQPSLDYYQLKKQEQIIPELPAIDIKQQEDTGIKIIPETPSIPIDKSIAGKAEKKGILVNKTPETKLTAAIVKVPVILSLIHI